MSGDDGENWRYTGFRVEGDEPIAYVAPRPGNPEGVYVGSFGQHIYESAAAEKPGGSGPSLECPISTATTNK